MDNQAFYYRKHGDIGCIEEGPWSAPTVSREQLLVRVRAVGLNPLDYRMRRGEMKLLTGWNLPRLLCSDFSGEVLEVGANVADFQCGDRVYGMVNQVTTGTTTDTIAVSTSHLASAPTSLDLQQAAAVPLAALTALQALRDLAGAASGQRVLINGASGGVGTFGVQIARILGCQVTAVTSYRNLDWMEELGADEVIDYTTTDPLAQRGRYDVIFDAYGNKSFGSARAALTPRGIYVTTIPDAGNALGVLRSALTAQRSRVVLVRSKRKDLETLGAWIDEGAIHPVVEKVYPRAEVHQAYTHLESKRSKGKLVIAMSTPAAPGA